MKYIYHHLGLGDHIMCNGIVRHFKEIHNNVTVFCKPHYFNNVEYMYRDDKDITVLPIGEDSDVLNYIRKHNLHSDLIMVGFNLPGYGNGKTFDEGFYHTVNLPFKYRPSFAPHWTREDVSEWVTEFESKKWDFTEPRSMKINYLEDDVE